MNVEFWHTHRPLNLGKETGGVTCIACNEVQAGWPAVELRVADLNRQVCWLLELRVAYLNRQVCWLLELRVAD